MGCRFLVSESHIINNDLRRAAAVPCIDADAADDVERLATVREEMANAEADGAERADGGGDVPASIPDKSGILQKDTAQEEPRLGIALPERFEFLQALAEIERDGRGRQDGVDREESSEIFRRNAARHIVLERRDEFFEVFPRERASRRLRMAAEAPEEMCRTSEEFGDVDCGNAPQRRRAHVAGNVRDHARPPKFLRELPREEPDDAGGKFFVRDANERGEVVVQRESREKPGEQFLDERLAGGIELVEDIDGRPSIEEGAQSEHRIIHATGSIDSRGNAKANITTVQASVGERRSCRSRP